MRFKRVKREPTGGFLPSTYFRSRGIYAAFNGVRTALETGNYEQAGRELETAHVEAKRQLDKHHAGRKVLRIRKKTELPVVLQNKYSAMELEEKLNDLKQELEKHIADAKTAREAENAVASALENHNKIREIIPTGEKAHGEKLKAAAISMVKRGNSVETLEGLLLKTKTPQVTVDQAGKIHTTRLMHTDSIRYLQEVVDAMRTYLIRKQRFNPSKLNEETDKLCKELGIDTQRSKQLVDAFARQRSAMKGNTDKLHEIAKRHAAWGRT